MVRPGQDRIGQILDYLGRHPHDAGIIYCLSRKSCEMIAQKLQQKGIKAGFYHAGLTPNQRAGRCRRRFCRMTCR